MGDDESSSAGHRERFQLLWDLHYEQVARFASRRLPGDDEVADVVSDTYLAAWRHIEELNPETARAWLLGTARRQMANRLRGRRRQAALAQRIAADPTSAGTAATDGSDGSRESLGAAFNGLSALDREAIALVTWEELTPAEAADVLQIPAARFRVRLHRAKARLRDLAQQGVPVEPLSREQPQTTEGHP